MISDYYDTAAIRESVRNGHQREIVGGLWDEIGALQMEFLLRSGLSPQDRFLDLGCGSLRLGCRLVKYLEPGRYYGTDINRSLLDAGYADEIVAKGLADSLPRENLLEDADFAVDRFGVQFDRVLAFSVFTHLSPPVIRNCLEKLWPSVRPGGVFNATWFEVAPDEVDQPFTHPRAGIITYPDRDPYHQTLPLYRDLIADLPWQLTNIGDFNHPRGQKMLRFERV